jgi:hypothetical protein
LQDDITLKSLKLEEGKTATVWSAAPEDSLSANVNNNFSWKFDPKEGMYIWNGQ